MARKKKQQARSPAWKVDKNVKLATAAAILVGTIAAGVWSFEVRYAKAEETNKKFEALQTTIIEGQKRSEKYQMISERRALEAEKRGLQREQFDFINVQQKRKLTDTETQRFKVVTEEIGRLDGEIKVLKDREMQDSKR